MTRGRDDGGPKKRLVASLLILVSFVCFLYAYSRNQGSSALEYGSKSLRKLGSSYWGGDEDTDIGGKQYESTSIFGGGENDAMLKRIPVSCFQPNIFYLSRQ